MDQFGPVLVPATLTWHIGQEDHHTYRTTVDLSAGLCAMTVDDVTSIVEQLETMDAADAPSALIATLCDWDREFAADMDDADWHSVTIVSVEQTVPALRAARDSDLATQI